MKYVVVGQNRDTGARMSLEFEAESKGAAERKATQAGMSVRHVTEVTDAPPAAGHTGAVAAAGPPSHPARTSTPATGDFRPIRQSGGGLVKLIVLVLIVTAVWYFWPQIRSLLPKGVGGTRAALVSFASDRSPAPAPPATLPAWTT